MWRKDICSPLCSVKRNFYLFLTVRNQKETSWINNPVLILEETYTLGQYIPNSLYENLTRFFFPLSVVHTLVSFGPVSIHLPLSVYLISDPFSGLRRRYNELKVGVKMTKNRYTETHLENT